MSIVITLLLIVFVIFLITSKRGREKQFIKFVANVQRENENGYSIGQVPKTPNKSYGLDEKTTLRIIEGLKRTEKNGYYLKKECTSHNLAKRLKTNRIYLSKAIKSHYNCTFNEYINSLRVNHVILRLEDDAQFRKYSIQSMAEEVGYKSSDSFNKNFRRRTGFLPSNYIKNTLSNVL